MVGSSRAVVIFGISFLILVMSGACANWPQPEPVRARVQPAAGWSELQLEVSQADLPLQLSSRSLAVIDRAPPAGVPTAAALRLRPPEKLPAWPVEGRLSQPFGCSPFYSGLAGPGCPADSPWFHDGLDLAVPAGTPVKATLTGTVIFAGPDGSGPACGGYRGYGLGVVIDDGAGRQTLYAHLARIDVAVGQLVTSADMIIGASGATGCVSGPHLHFGLRLDDQLVDPLAYLPDQ